MGKLFIVLGVALFTVGLLITFKISIPWLGKLPGDINFKGDHVQFYFPIVSCVLISILLSILFFFLRRWL